MKILIIPMAVMAETSGPSLRCRILTEEFHRAGHDVATCMAEDVNFKCIEGIQNYALAVPMPFGLSTPIAKRIFPLAQKLGITSRVMVDSFDQVLCMTGNLDYRYLKKSVSSIRKAIQDFHPDAIYSEFNISAMIAAQIEAISLYCTVSYPTQYEYAHDTRRSKDLNRFLREMSLPTVDSALQLFDRAEQLFCPSIRELEPFSKEKVQYCGALQAAAYESARVSPKNKILVYMGNGTIPAKKMRRVICEAFEHSVYEVYIASSYLQEEDWENVHIASRWNFYTLLDEAVLFIHHGGQNSMVEGFLHGVPQLVVPGKVFERKYNAKSIAEHHAGLMIEEHEFTAETIRNKAKKIMEEDTMIASAQELGRKLAKAGGAGKIIRGIESFKKMK